MTYNKEEEEVGKIKNETTARDVVGSGGGIGFIKIYGIFILTSLSYSNSM